MDLGILLIQSLNAFQYGLLLFLVASGLTLIFGIMGIINLAHGSFYMIGAYMAFVLTSMTGNLMLTIALGIPLAFALGALLERFLFTYLYKREHLEQVLLTYGLILIFEELRSLAVGDDVHGVAVPALFSASIPLSDTLSYPVYRIVISVVCLALAAGLYFLIQRTRLGMMIRGRPLNLLPDPSLVEMAGRYWAVHSLWAGSELGYHPRPPEETLRDTVAWIREHRGSGHPGTG